MKEKAYVTPVMKFITMPQCDVIRTSESVGGGTNPFVDDQYVFDN